jgi:hypothetical protein
MDTEMKTIHDSMKLIVEQTNSILKHSTSAFKKTKEKLVVLTDVKMKPNEKTVEWFSERGIKKITIPDFFDLVFSEASQKNFLQFDTKTIMFDEKDASVFGFEPRTPIPILLFFESVPNYFL